MTGRRRQTSWNPVKNKKLHHAALLFALFDGPLAKHSALSQDLYTFPSDKQKLLCCARSTNAYSIDQCRCITNLVPLLSIESYHVQNQAATLCYNLRYNNHRESNLLPCVVTIAYDASPCKVFRLMLSVLIQILC